jgi:hypothetical protein
MLLRKSKSSRPTAIWPSLFILKRLSSK